MTRERLLAFAVPALIAGWAALYVPLALISHFALRTNAFDLSVFDYALWSTTQGQPGAVPFMGHTLWSHHVMPTLFALLPLYIVTPGPVLLILVQLGAMAAAAVLFHRLASRYAPPPLVLALLFAFLFSRRSHGAVTSYFYIESLEPALVLALIYAHVKSWPSWTFWTLAALALGCKEDMALYLGVFGLLLWRTGSTRRGISLALVSAVWLIAATQVAIPSARTRDGLSATNPFIAERLGSPATAIADAASRVASTRAVAQVITLTSATGFLSWAAPGWLFVAAPGVLVNLAARPNTLQAGSLGHYAWPILPWLFMAGALGAGRLARWSPRAVRSVAAVVALVTVVDSPLWLSLARQPWRGLDQGSAVREQLSAFDPRDGNVIAQPNLIPHMTHLNRVQAVGRELQPGAKPDYVLLSDAGDLWPLGPDGVTERVRLLRSHPDYRLTSTPPLYIFERSSVRRLDRAAR